MADLLVALQYATVKPYWGCPEVLDVAQPYVAPMMYGAGFGVVLAIHRTVVWALGGDRRRGERRGQL